ncbi:MAG: TVP38/TMEM64 family protein [Nitrospinae bacterium]|nr:TVP38/TMEM64 family protein [Nitrospinota bacterium]
MNRRTLKIGLVAFVLVAIAAFFIFDLQRYASLDFLKARRHAFQSYYDDYPLPVLAVFGLAYVIVTALSLPVATALTLVGGALFGFFPALVIVSFASTIGATLAFLTARFLLKDWVQKKYGPQLLKINDGFAAEGAFYLFALRLTPVAPFFLVNILTAMTPVRVRTFYAVSQVGMLPGTAAYVYAGTELGRIAALSDVVSPRLMLAFTLLGLFPLVAKKTVDSLKKRKAA